jgi:hypothetical protein
MLFTKLAFNFNIKLLNMIYKDKEVFFKLFCVVDQPEKAL